MLPSNRITGAAVDAVERLPRIDHLAHRGQRGDRAGEPVEHGLRVGVAERARFGVGGDQIARWPRSPRPRTSTACSPPGWRSGARPEHDRHNHRRPGHQRHACSDPASPPRPAAGNEADFLGTRGLGHRAFLGLRHRASLGLRHRRSLGLRHRRSLRPAEHRPVRRPRRVRTAAARSRRPCSPPGRPGCCGPPNRTGGRSRSRPPEPLAVGSGTLTPCERRHCANLTSACWRCWICAGVRLGRVNACEK